jgi:release factor glutamine methyltransferase
MNTKKIPQIARQLADRLRPVYDSEQNALSHAWWLLEWLTGKSRAFLIAQTTGLTSEQEHKLALVEHKLIKEHMPLAYIIGEVQFLDLTLMIKPPILIPRPETEQWVSWLIAQLKQLSDQKFTILDLCTGSGCIGLALAYAFKNAHIYAVDISSKACELARQNANRNNITNITIVQSDLYKQLPEDICFDVIVSNPPYISPAQWQELDPMVKDWEDPDALVAEDNGLYLIKKIIEQAPLWLRAQDNFKQLHIPRLVIEIGNLQGEAVKKFCCEGGFKTVKILQDFFGQDRIVTAEI